MSPWLLMTVFKSWAMARLTSRLGSPVIPCSLVPHPRLLPSLTSHLYLPSLLTVFPTPLPLQPPLSHPSLLLPTPGMSPTTPRPPHTAARELHGKEKDASRFHGRLSVKTVPSGSARFGVLYIHKSGFACFGFMLVFWLSVWYSAFFLYETESGSLCWNNTRGLKVVTQNLELFRGKDTV